MSWSHVRLLLRKELLEVVRDRRSVFLMLVLPMLLYPLLLIVSVNVVQYQMTKTAESDMRVGFAVTPGITPFIRGLKESERLQPIPLPVSQLEDTLRAGHVDVAVVFSPDLESALRNETKTVVRVLFDETRAISKSAADRVEGVLGDWWDALIDERLKRRGSTGDWLVPLASERTSIATPQEVGGHLLGGAVPMLVILMIVLGAFYPAVEVTAGEKERGTLQTLLTAPMTPIEIVTGKFLAVFVVAAVTAAANILSIVLVVSLGSLLPDQASDMLDLNQSMSTIALLGLLALVAGLFFSSVMMTVAVMARSTREAQTYLAPVYLLCVLPVMLVQIPGVELTGGWVLVPVVNLAILMRDVLASGASLHEVFVVVVTTLMYTGCALVAAASIFRREAIMLGDVGIGGLFTRETGASPRTVPRLGEAFALITLIFLLYFYVGSVLQIRLGVTGIAISQWGLLLLPAVLILRWKGLSVVRSLSLVRPRWRHLLGGVLLGASLWYPLMLAARWVMVGDASPTESASEEVLTSLISTTPVWLLLTVLALTPAICEELLFRGVFLKALQGSMRPLHAALACGFLFGAFHLSLVGFVPKTILGVVLALMVLQCGSVWPAIAFHAIHNAISLLIARYDLPLPGIVDDASPLLWQVVLACLAIALGTFLLAHRRPSDSSP